MSSIATVDFKRRVSAEPVNRLALVRRPLVNNAANDKCHKIAEVTPEFYDETIAVNSVTSSSRRKP